MQPPSILRTTHFVNRSVISAFAQGCGGEVLDIEEAVQINPSRVATYGILRGTSALIKSAKEFWYIDRGYFGERNSENAYFRVTKNHFIHKGDGDHDWTRFKKFNKKLKPWQKEGRNILVVPPSKPAAAHLGINNWVDNTLKEIIKNTDRDIVISRKPNDVVKGIYSELESHPQVKRAQIPLTEGMKYAWVLVTDHSNAMVEALIEGVPIICTNANRKIGSINNIEHPIHQRDFLKNLAYNQWTLKEMASGKAWKELNREG
jgi:hypothetical protein